MDVRLIILFIAGVFFQGCTSLAYRPVVSSKNTDYEKKQKLFELQIETVRDNTNLIKKLVKQGVIFSNSKRAGQGLRLLFKKESENFCKKYANTPLYYTLTTSQEREITSYSSYSSSSGKVDDYGNVSSSSYGSTSPNYRYFSLVKIQCQLPKRTVSSTEKSSLITFIVTATRSNRAILLLSENNEILNLSQGDVLQVVGMKGSITILQINEEGNKILVRINGSSIRMKQSYESFLI